MSKPLWTSAAIAAATGGKASGAWNVSNLSIDTRTIKAGDLFIALKGPSFDGNDFVKDALARGAAGALTTQNEPADKVVTVSDTMEALQKLGAASRARSKAKIIAVTGSVGKTGCKEALRQVLGAQGASFASQGSFNNHWGVPFSLAQMPEDTAYGIFEIGMNHVGELGPLSNMVKPDIALITGIAAVHLGNFKNLAEIATAKAEIFEGLKTGGVAVLPGDDAHYPTLYEAAKRAGASRIARFGKGEGFEARVLNFTLNAENTSVTASVLGKTVTYNIGVPGAHWVHNSLAVLLCAALAGADVEKAAAAFAHLNLAQGRGAAKTISFSGGSFTLVDESYNASPVAVEAAIRVLAQRKPKMGGRRILALADMKELGDQTESLHKGLAAPIVEANIDLVYGCGQAMQYLMDSLPAARRGGWFESSAQLAALLAEQIRDGDVITVKGSHSMMMEKVVAALSGLASTPQKKSAI